MKQQRETEKQFFQKVKCPSCGNVRGIWRKKSNKGKVVSTTCSKPGCWKKFKVLAE